MHATVVGAIGLVSLSMGQTPPDLGAAVAGYERCCRHYETVAVRVEARRRIDEWLEDRSLPSDRIVAVSQIRCWRDGPRIHVISDDTLRGLSGGQVATLDTSDEMLLTPSVSFSLARDKHTGRLEPGVSVTARDRTRPALENIHYVGLPIFGASFDLDGPGLVKQLADARPTVAADTASGKPVVRIDFEDQWGIHSLWLDPVRDYHPLRMTQRKSGKHKSRGGLPLESVGTPNRNFTAVTTEVVVSELKQVAGAWFANIYEVRAKWADGKSKRADAQTMIYRVLELSTDPLSGGNQFKLITPLPDGTPVMVPGQEPIRFEFRGGEVVKAVDGSQAEVLSSQNFKTSTSWWPWTAAAVLAIVGIVAGVVWRRRSAAV